MSKRLMVLAASTAALLMVTAGGALADGSASASASSGATSVAHGDQGSGGTVTIGSGSNENAAAQPGAGSNSQAGAGGGGIAGTFYFVIGGREIGAAITTEEVPIGGGGLAGEGSFAGASAGAHGSVWAQGALAEASSTEVGASSGGSATLYCKLTIKNWTKWWDYSRDVRKIVQRCDCPTEPKVAKLSKSCPAKPTEVFAAVVQ